MLFGVHLPNSGPFANLESISAVAKEAERLGYDALQPHDHIVWGAEDIYHFYAGSVEAADAHPAPFDFFDSLTTMSYLAGITERVKLIPSAMCLAWRDIALMCRQVLTLHQLSRGRFVLNVCVGNIRNDFGVTSTAWDQRGKIAVEKLKVLRKLIDPPSPRQSGGSQGEPISFQGDYVKLERADLYPRPHGLPLWYAGTSDVAIRRAARYAEGWWPAGSPEYFSTKIPVLLEEARKAGRGDVDFQLGTEAFTCVAGTADKAWEIAERTVEAHSQSEWMQRHDATARRSRTRLVGTPDSVADGVREYIDAGLTRLNLCFIGRTKEALLEQMEMFASQVMPRVDP